MMSNYRWTVRNIDRRAVETLREIARITGEPLGQLASEAIHDWAEGLLIVDVDDAGDD